MPRAWATATCAKLARSTIAMTTKLGWMPRPRNGWWPCVPPAPPMAVPTTNTATPSVWRWCRCGACARSWRPRCRTWTQRPLPTGWRRRSSWGMQASITSWRSRGPGWPACAAVAPRPSRRCTPRSRRPRWRGSCSGPSAWPTRSARRSAAWGTRKARCNGCGTPATWCSPPAGRARPAMAWCNRPRCTWSWAATGRPATCS